MKSNTSTGLAFGWVVSVLLHVGVVAFAFVGLPYLTRPTPAPPPPVAIEFVKIAAKTQQVIPEQEKQQEQEQEQERSKFAASAVQEADLADAVPLPEKQTPKVVPKPKPKPKPQLSEARKLASAIRPRSKPKPPSRLKVSQLQRALLDKAAKEQNEVTKKSDKPKEEKKKADEPKKKPSALAGLAGRLATASIRDALSQKLAGCWNFPTGAKNAETFQVKVRISLREDGNLRRQPEIVQSGDMSQGFYRVFVESARRAVLNCAPYSDVAKSLFDLGENTIDFNFDGAEFAGG
ncbi:hypothetical protein KFE96_14955 [Kordiimonas sp. SCSIO 12603]|uniref:hypothetical protein n=1 Tax=Kordiimonas sp. SCSIO 12603 TaxID=2829596 RepID=UPI0021073C04|nr:hypothetical protein [Kordiimonas sp. SCSIO 12603]UTW58106.1 hypothetical protein KFE96_14955 [Kordiimonas sp. SCSIO 12603]